MYSSDKNSSEDNFVEMVQVKSRRRKRAEREQGTVWFGLGTFGMVGWSVVVPTIIGVLLGTWLDVNLAANFSWRLTLLILGVVIGCVNAWHWVSKERRHAQEERERYENV